MMMIMINEKALCLIHSESIAVLEEYNIIRHYNSMQLGKYIKLCRCPEKKKMYDLKTKT